MKLHVGPPLNLTSVCIVNFCILNISKCCFRIFHFPITGLHLCICMTAADLHRSCSSNTAAHQPSSASMYFGKSSSSSTSLLSRTGFRKDSQLCTTSFLSAARYPTTNLCPSISRQKCEGFVPLSLQRVATKEDKS